MANAQSLKRGFPLHALSYIFTQICNKYYLIVQKNNFGVCITYLKVDRCQYCVKTMSYNLVDNLSTFDCEGVNHATLFYVNEWTRFSVSKKNEARGVIAVKWYYAS